MVSSFAGMEARRIAANIVKLPGLAAERLRADARRSERLSQ
jgi:hypothetical protein